MLLNLIHSLQFLILIAVGTVYSGISGWPFELLTHWIVTWLLLSAVLCGVAISQKQWRHSFLAMVLVLTLGVKLCTGYAYDVVQQDRAASNPITLAQWNIYNGNDYVFEWIEKQQGIDVIVLNEVKPWVRDRIADTKLAGYPYTLLPEGLAPDTVILSKLPLENTSITTVENSPRFVLKAEIARGGKRAALIAMHMTSPRSPERYARRNLELKALAEKVREQTLPVIVAGDLNVTTYSPDFVAFMKESGLALTTKPILLPVTWPAITPVPGLGLSIDHTLLSKQLRLVKRSTQLGVCCSDHTPVVTTIDLSIK